MGTSKWKKVKVVGGVGDRSMWGKQYHQDARIYDSKCLAPVMSARLSNVWILVYENSSKTSNKDRIH